MKKKETLKVGDRVEVDLKAALLNRGCPLTHTDKILIAHWQKCPANRKGTLKHAEGGGVEFDLPLPETLGHTLSGMAKDFHGRWMALSFLKKISTPDTTLTAQEIVELLLK